MIRRRIEDGFLLIQQSHHALLAARLVELFGAGFAPASDPDGLARAAQLHESGYDETDRVVRLSAAGRPAHYTELTIIQMLQAWTRSADLAEPAGAYPAMLVSLLTLQRSAALPSVTRTLREYFEINKLQHREIERQERLRPELGLRNDVPMRYGLPEAVVQLTDAEADLSYDYRLLVLLSQVTLEACTRTKVSGEFLPCPNAPRADTVQVRYVWRGETQLQLRPWPFSEREVPLQVSGLQVPGRSYEHAIELEEVMRTAPQRIVDVTLIAGE